MSKLKWDQTGEKLYETGIEQVVLYKMNASGAYENGVAWNGVTKYDDNPSGAEATKLYADNSVYVTLLSTEEYGSTMEAYMSPEEFDECDGCAELTDGVTIGQQERVGFGLALKTLIGNDVKKNDYGYKLKLVYGLTATPSQKSYETVNDSPAAASLSWDLTSTPVAVTGHKPTSIVEIDSTKVDAKVLKAIEDKIYGTDEDEPTLPLPDELLQIITTAKAAG